MTLTHKVDRLDIGAGALTLVLLLLIGATLLGGDRAGVAIVGFSPVERAHTTTPIRLIFGEPMDAASVQARFAIKPPMTGRFEWSGTQLTFRPDRAWTPGQTYTVIVGAGAVGMSRRQIVADVSWSFRVDAPRIAYLAPALRSTVRSETEPTNIWLVDPTKPFGPERITDSGVGVEQFRPSPDGTQIAYVQPGPEGSADLWLVDVQTRQSRRITNCAAVQARCQAPAWSPDSTRLAYERIELNPALPDYDRGVPRTWIVTLRDLSTAPLLNDPIRLGGTPLWSPDGSHIAVHDRNLGAIVIYNITTGLNQIIPTLDDSGEYAFDRQGKRFVYPQLVLTANRFTSELELADLSDPQGGIRRLSAADSPAIEDKLPDWHPDGLRLVMTRRSLDGSGPNNAQIYWLDPSTAKTEPLVVDPQFFHGAISFDPTGTQLVMQRVASSEAQPGIWVLDVSTGEVRQVAHNGYLPRWLP